MTTPDWLERYRAGHEDEVWAELRALGDGVRDHEYLDTAIAVCDEMAHRALLNVERVISGLKGQGYRFTTNDDSGIIVQPHSRPTSDADDLATWLDHHFGVPLALQSWLRIVGDVWLVGVYPKWPTAAAGDPLVIQVETALGAHRDARRHFLAAQERYEALDPRARGALVLDVSPNRAEKSKSGAGEPYGFLVPDRSAEGVFRAGRELPFVSYLNEVFTHAGFPHHTGDDHQDVLIAAVKPRMLHL